MLSADELFYFSGIEKKAGKVIYRQFRINRHELNMLVGLSAYLRVHDRKIISRKVFTDWLGLNYGLEKRCWAYIKGLVDKGVLHRLAFKRPDGNCLAISDYGIRVLDLFCDTINKIERKDQARKSRTYKDLGINLDTLPAGYKLMQAGRS